MGLKTCSVTVCEVAGDGSEFPGPIRDLLCEAVSAISAQELHELMDKHESDPGNFDGRIEEVIRSMQPDLTLHANHQVFDGAKFNNDLVIETDNTFVCLEIEKSSMSRFEFDILKMQAFASHRLAELPGARVYGAFIVPADNIVARHISGNARESSYKYLSRLSRLVAQISPSPLADVLIVGYGVSMPDGQVTQRKGKTMKKKPASVDKKSSGNVVVADAGLLPEELLWDVLRGYPQELVSELRKCLAAKYPGLREKINRNSKYLGYANGGSDAMYVYVRKNYLLIDLGVSADLSDDLRQLGFEVKPRDNFQAKIGWLTGLIVPHDTDKFEDVAKLAIDALSRE